MDVLFLMNKKRDKKIAWTSTEGCPQQPHQWLWSIIVAKLAIPKGIPAEEVKAEIETDPVTA